MSLAFQQPMTIKFSKKKVTESSNDHKVYGSDVLLFNVIPMWILFAAKSVLIGFMFQTRSSKSTTITYINNQSQC